VMTQPNRGTTTAAPTPSKTQPYQGIAALFRACGASSIGDLPELCQNF
jgi:hypothetical protein